MGDHEHEWHTLPASDLNGELPLYCPECMGAVMWFDGTVMTTSEWNAFYDKNGNLLDANNDPSIHNRTQETADHA